jgi:ABC-type multidrug transport system ATPase subunit
MSKAQQKAPGERPVSGSPGDPDGGPGVIVMTKEPFWAFPRPRTPEQRVQIGRASDSDIVITDDLTVSRRHAELIRSAGRTRIVDLGSSGGTFVDGVRVREAELCEGSVLGIGRALFVLREGRLQQYVDDRADLAVDKLTVTVDRDKRLLDEVSFVLGQRQMLAVIGTTGAGKSTLLKALTGYRPADSGAVRYCDRDLYAQLDELRSRIGYVPQDDILHVSLTLRTALDYAAELRFADDTTAAERCTRVEQVLAELGLTEHQNTRIDRLSGGQRKRASVAVELLTSPALLFLDEPTSGLDPGFERSVMQLLRTMSDAGRTIVVTTHAMDSLDLCDRVLVLTAGGRTVYYGPPAAMLTHFGVRTHAEMFQLLQEQPSRDWPGHYRASDHHRRHITDPLERLADRPAPAPGATGGSASVAGWSRQLSTLARRNLTLLTSGRSQTVLLFAQAPVIAGLLLLFFGRHNLEVRDGAKARQVLFMLVIGAVAIGLVNACREIVKERPVLLRERTVGLSTGAYLTAKVLCLGAVTAVQTLVLGAIVLPAQDAGRLTVPLLTGLIAASVTAMTVGLLVSAAVTTEATSLLLVPILLVAQLLLCNALVPAENNALMTPLTWTSPAYWGFRTAAATTDLNALDPSCRRPRSKSAFTPCSPHWMSDRTTRTGNLAVTAGLALTYAFAAAALLQGSDSARRRRRR